ncbi:MAG TPA: DNA-3-methyladenine glycosylase 2 family protein [Panacibacter sp.]|nr:DNA-3-methyladenine glycosylase 2 family protein [Panacibacter sp.]
MVQTFNKDNFQLLCDKLGKKDKHLLAIIKTYGYPPLWSRTPSFATLINIILEQQVSLAAAKAAFNKLQEKIGPVTPEKILLLSDEELKACYFSRQKIIYARYLAGAIVNKEISIDELNALPDEEIRTHLKKLKGIGDWTADVYLMMSLNRCNCFPTGDIALIKSIKEVKVLPAETTKEAILQLANSWQPYRTIAAYLLWHAYIIKRNIKL